MAHRTDLSDALGAVAPLLAPFGCPGAVLAER